MGQAEDFQVLPRGSGTQQKILESLCAGHKMSLVLDAILPHESRAQQKLPHGSGTQQKILKSLCAGHEINLVQDAVLPHESRTQQKLPHGSGTQRKICTCFRPFFSVGEGPSGRGKI